MTTPLGRRALVAGPRIPVNPPYVGYHGEVEVAADPESAENLIVCGYRANARTGSGYEGYVYQSADEGNTWSEELVDAQSQWVSEESCAFGPGHRAYFASGVSDTSHGEPHHEYGNLYLYRSFNAGDSWQRVLVNDFMDFTSMTVDSGASHGRGSLYLFANALVDGKAGGWQMMDRTPYLAAFREMPDLNFSVISGSFHANASGETVSAMYPTASAVLSNGAVLALFPDDGKPPTTKLATEQRLFSVVVGISSDGGKTLHKSLVYQSTDPAVATGLAVDRKTDQIYVCWTPRYPGTVASRLTLATSNDRGNSWKVGSVKLPDDTAADIRVGSVSVAMNKSGVLGFMWYGKNADQVYFGASFDRGASIAEILPLIPVLPSSQLPQQPQADDRRLFVYPPVWKNSTHSLDPLGILLFGPNPWGVPSGNALVADVKGVFHPVWNEVANGSTHLWTRAISLRASDEPVSDLSTNGLSNIDDRVVWHVSNVRYDQIANRVLFDLEVTNESEVTVKGPLLVELPGAREPATVAADNADNQESGNGGLWTLPVPPDGLQCQHSTARRTFSFHVLQSGEDVLQDNKLLTVPLRIYGRLAAP